MVKIKPIRKAIDTYPILKKIGIKGLNIIEPVISKIKFYSTYRYLNKISCKIKNDSSPSIDNIEKSNRIWIMWMQGVENAPDIVKICIDSIKNNLGNNHEVIILTEKNIDDYVELPLHIIEKRNEGKISVQHYSDIVRTYLLSNYGGLWIDATMLCTGSKLFTDVIEKQSIFSFQSDMFDGGFTAWFIYADKNNRIIEYMYELFIEYWKHNDELMYYFMVDVAFILSSKKYPDDKWFSIPKYDCKPVLKMGNMLLNDYDFQIVDSIIKESDFHKLSWKIKSDNPNSILNNIIAKNIQHK